MSGLKLLQIFTPYFVCLPIFSAIMCCMLNERPGFAKKINLFTTLILACIAFLGICITKKLPHDPIFYELGNFSYRIGIRFKIDLFASFGLFFVCFLHLLNSIFQSATQSKTPGVRLGMFLMVIAGLNGLIITNDMFNLYVFLEITSIASYILCVNKWNRASYVAALEYLIIGTIAGCLVLFGIGFLYASFGTLNMSEIYDSINSSSNFGDLTIYSLIFIILGLLVKTGIYPFHGWYLKVSRSITPSTLAFFSYSLSQVTLLIIVKLLYSVYGIHFTSSITRYFFGIINVIAVLSIIVGSINAIRARFFVDVLAWSSIAQTGYLVIGFLSDNELILCGALMQIFANSISKIVIFFTYQKMLSISNPSGFISVSDAGRFDYSSFRMPLIITLINLAGLPMTIGFISKIYMIVGCVSEDRTAIFLTMILGAILGAIYTFRIIEQVILGNKPGDVPTMTEFYKINITICEKILYIITAIATIMLPFWQKFATYIKLVADSILQII